MSDGDVGIYLAASAMCSVLIWLNCYYHVQKNLKIKLKGKGLLPGFQEEVFTAFQTLHLAWTSDIFKAGWAALEDLYGKEHVCLEHARREYIEQREGWYVGCSPAGVPVATAAECFAKMIKDVTKHKRSGMIEFIKIGLPEFTATWGHQAENFSGRAPQPKPWLWQEAQAILQSKNFLDMENALYFKQGSVNKKKRAASGQKVREYPPIEKEDVVQWGKHLNMIEHGSRETWDNYVAFLRMHRVAANGCTCAEYHVMGVCEGVLLYLFDGQGTGQTS